MSFQVESPGNIKGQNSSNSRNGTRTSFVGQGSITQGGTGTYDIFIIS